MDGTNLLAIGIDRWDDGLGGLPTHQSQLGSLGTGQALEHLSHGIPRQVDALLMLVD